MGNEIDPQQFGLLQGQVEGLTRMVTELATDMKAVREQLAEAKGGWRLLLLLGGAAASAGGLIGWALTHFSR